MSSLNYVDMFKLIFKVIGFKYEQKKLTSSVYSIVKITNGPVKGVKRVTIWGDSYFSFEGIPFAKPPLGNLRFKAPVPADPWNTVLNCTGPAEKPLQSNIFFRKYKGSEDCLYLNIFTNDVTPNIPRPVMVWIYGGGFQIGEASRDMYSPDFFMSKDVVLVTVAYRLGPFGFLSISEPEVNVPGNAGLKDQILSLKWVQENIAAFGGDPKNVTLFGESAGGASTHLCMLSEQSKGLIQRSIVMSGSVLCPWARPPNNKWVYRLARALGYHGEEKDKEVYTFLQNAKGPEMVRAVSTILTKEEKHHRVVFAFGPVVEPYETDQCILSKDPNELMRETWSNEIPMMIGGTSFEGLLFYPEINRRPATLDEVGNCRNLLPMDLKVDLKSKEAEDLALRLKSSYFGNEECSRESMMKFLDLMSYREFWFPMYRTMLARVKHSMAPTYVYRFDYDSNNGNAIRNLLCGRGFHGACHGDDLCYLYHCMFAHRALKGSQEYTITKKMIDIWTSFGAKGDPNCESLDGVKFKPLANDQEIKCLNITEKVEFIDLPELDKLKVWNSFCAKEL